jgi:CspA family cold shock protein
MPPKKTRTTAYAEVRLRTIPGKPAVAVCCTRFPRVVKFFNTEKNSGFIVPDDESSDVFVHGSDVTGPQLQAGERVRFEPVKGYGNLKATNVQHMETGAPQTDEPPF